MELLEKIKFVEEKNKIFLKTSDSKIKLKYPHILDNEFQRKIALKKEFQYKYDGEIKDILEEDEKGTLCNRSGDFSLSPHQEFVKMFINENTPYNGLLLYHGMGSGKTCSAIGITEAYRKSNKYNPKMKKIIIIASPNVQENFKLQLFNKDKLKKENKTWKLGGCVGTSLLHELKNYDIDNLTKEQIIRKIDKMINKSYVFVGYDKFANKIEKLIDVDIEDNSTKRKKIRKILNQVFNDSMIVIDEVHNIRLSGESNSKGETKTKKIANAMLKLVQYVNHLKLLFLSGTPMYNDPKEIIFILNLLHMNDGHNVIYNKDIFDKNGDLIEGSGEKTLREKCNGYISYVRGENPYNFPFKIYPNDYNSQSSIKNIPYPRQQFNKKVINDPLRLLDIHLSNISNVQQNGYLRSIQIMYESMTPEQIEKFESLDSFSYNKLQEPLNMLNICYTTKNKDGSDIFYTGKEGLNEVVTYQEKTGEYMKKYNYDYIIDEPIFQYNNIGKYSAKIKSIIDHIMKSEGIILIYSQYLDAGLVPLALTLEELGFGRLQHNDLLKPNSERKPLNSLTMNYENNKNGEFRQCKYSMITGDPYHSPKDNNSKELRFINRDENINGEVCKVVLISQAGSEGLDFQNLRQVHIMEPWYNLNRIEQIIGRAIRNCSHARLPLEKRNCQILLHASYLNEQEEAADLLLYRYAEKKSEKIGKIQKILKSMSVDCLLNIEQMNFSKYLDQTIKIKLSTGDKIDFNIKDKPYSSICDYNELCDYTCHNKIVGENQIDDTTYGVSNLLNEKLILSIKKLFMKGFVYDRKTIISLLLTKNISIEQIEHSLEQLITSKETIVDKYMRKGYIVNMKDLYLFKPFELEKEFSLLYDLKRPTNIKTKELKHFFEDGKLRKNDKPTKNTSTKALPQKKTLKETAKELELIEIEKVNALLEDINQKVDDVMDPELIRDNDKYEETYSHVINTLNSIIPNMKITEDMKQKFIIQSIHETLLVEDEILLLKYLLKNESSLNKTEKLLLEVFKKFIHSSQNAEDKEIKLYFTTNLKDSRITPLIYRILRNNDNIIIKIATQNVRNEFGIDKVSKILKIPENRELSKQLTFMSYKKGYFELKIKDTKAKRHQGASFEQKSPKQKMPILNEIIGEEIFIPKSKNNQGTNSKFSKVQWNIILEVLSKYYTLVEKNDEIFYLDKIFVAANL